jgi:hypothetical protein
MAWAGQPAIRFSRYKSARVTAPVFPIHHGYGTCNPFRSCPIAPRRLPNSLLMAFLPRVGRKASGSRKISMSSEKMIWSGARCSQALEHCRVLFQLLSDRADHGAHAGWLSVDDFEETLKASCLRQEHESALDRFCAREFAGVSCPAEEIKDCSICLGKIPSSATTTRDSSRKSKPARNRCRVFQQLHNWTFRRSRPLVATNQSRGDRHNAYSPQRAACSAWRVNCSGS